MKGRIPPRNRVRLGRRPASAPSAREDILRSARQLIAREGLRGVSLRSIARRARVDPALIYRYFRNKEELFIEALRSSFTLIEAERGPEGFRLDGIGEKIVFRFLQMWGTPSRAPVIVSLLRAAAEDPRAAGQLREYIEGTIIPATREHLGASAERRAPLVGSVLMGVGVMRYLLRIEPLASMSDEEVSRCVGPLVSAVLKGTLEPSA